MSDVDCTPGREPRSVAASLSVFSRLPVMIAVLPCRTCDVVDPVVPEVQPVGGLVGSRSSAV